MNICFSKDAVLGLVEVYGKERAIDELTSTCRRIITIGINDLDTEVDCSVDVKLKQKINQDRDDSK